MMGYIILHSSPPLWNHWTFEDMVQMLSPKVIGKLQSIYLLGSKLMKQADENTLNLSSEVYYFLPAHLQMPLETMYGRS